MRTQAILLLALILVSSTNAQFLNVWNLLKGNAKESATDSIT